MPDTLAETRPPVPPFTLATATQKVRRRAVQEKFEPLIEGMYR